MPKKIMMIMWEPAPRLQDNAYDVVRSSCDPAKGHVVDHPVAFLVRDRYTHTLHELEMVRAVWA